MRCRAECSGLNAGLDAETQSKSLPHHHQASVVPDSLYVFFAYLFSSPDVPLFLPPSDFPLILPFLVCSFFIPWTQSVMSFPGSLVWANERGVLSSWSSSSLPHIMFSSFLSCDVHKQRLILVTFCFPRFSQGLTLEAPSVAPSPSSSRFSFDQRRGERKERGEGSRTTEEE